MGCEATGLMEQNGTVVGVRARCAPEEREEVRADLVVGCDGRHAISSRAAQLPVQEQGVPIDVLWFRIDRKPGDPENGLGYVNYGRLVVLINRGDYFQVGYIVAKGSFPAMQQRGLAAFHEELSRIVPFLADRAEALDDWSKLKLLTVQINRLQRWAVPGLLCIGDAAHAMSPVGGIGINIAVQDAIATANRLVPALHSGNLTIHDLIAVQHYREGAVRRTQNVQVLAHAMLSRVLSKPGPIKPPLLLRTATRVPGFQRLTARFIGLGLQPQHVQTPFVASA